MKNFVPTLLKTMITLVAMSFVFVACVDGNEKFVDNRDGKTYATTKIGKQVWMAQNLDYTMDDSYCYDGNCAKYGRLYTWNAAMKACPTGWHLPMDKEWDELAEALGEEAGTKLKSKEWDGTDAVGFHVIPIAEVQLGSFAYFWTATKYYPTNVYLRVFDDSGWHLGYGSVNDAYSVRCVKD